MIDSWNYKHLPTLYSLLVLFSLIPILLMSATYDDFHSTEKDFDLPSIPDYEFKTIQTIKWDIVKQYENGTNWGYIEICRSADGVDNLRCIWTGGGNRTEIFSQLIDLNVNQKWIQDSGYVEIINGTMNIKQQSFGWEWKPVNKAQQSIGDVKE